MTLLALDLHLRLVKLQKLLLAHLKDDVFDISRHHNEAQSIQLNNTNIVSQ